jgi:hypothetical protein
MVGDSLQTVGVDYDTRHCWYTGADCADAATGGRIDQIGVTPD